MGNYRIIGDELGLDFSDYSLRFVANLAGKTLSPGECAQTLENQLVQRFPWIPSEDIFAPAREKYHDVQDYCRFLCEVGEKHEKFMQGCEDRLERSLHG